MATNKWLNALEELKNTTHALRGNLRAGGVACRDEDLLQDLVAKVPSLAPITNSLEEQDVWKPDPLWVFVDPNGSGVSKTIREIYDEDTMASDYTYRGIYLIYGQEDTIDLKAVMKARTSSDTFITSDGARYDTNTNTTLIHYWDKNKDVIDSDGKRVRYVKIYTNTAVDYVPGFYRQLIWAIHNLGTQLNMFYPYDKTAYTLAGHSYECLELENKVNSYKNIYCCGFPRKLVNKSTSSTDITNTSYYSTNYEYYQIYGGAQQVIEYEGNTSLTSHTNIDLPAVKTYKPYKSLASLTINLGRMQNLVNLDLHEMDNLKTLSVYGTYYYSSGSGSMVAYINPRFYLNVPETVTNLTLKQLPQKNISLPSSLTTLSIMYCYLDTLILSDSVTSLTLQYCPNLESLHLANKGGTLTGLYGLKKVTVNNDFNAVLSLANSPLLEHDYIVMLLENLKDRTDLGALTLTLGATNLGKLTDEEKAIATNKNWTLA